MAGGCAEVCQCRIAPGEFSAFMEKCQEAHRAFSGLEGYAGLDLLYLDGTEAILIIRWSDSRLMDQHLPFILSSCMLRQWTDAAKGNGHRPAMLTTFNPLSP